MFVALPRVVQLPNAGLAGLICRLSQAQLQQCEGLQSEAWLGHQGTEGLSQEDMSHVVLGNSSR